MSKDVTLEVTTSVKKLDEGKLVWGPFKYTLKMVCTPEELVKLAATQAPVERAKGLRKMDAKQAKAFFTDNKVDVVAYSKASERPVTPEELLAQAKAASAALTPEQRAKLIKALQEG